MQKPRSLYLGLTQTCIVDLPGKDSQPLPEQKVSSIAVSFGLLWAFSTSQFFLLSFFFCLQSRELEGKKLQNTNLVGAYDSLWQELKTFAIRLLETRSYNQCNPNPPFIFVEKYGEVMKMCTH